MPGQPRDHPAAALQIDGVDGAPFLQIEGTEPDLAAVGSPRQHWVDDVKSLTRNYTEERHGARCVDDAQFDAGAALVVVVRKGNARTVWRDAHAEQDLADVGNQNLADRVFEAVFFVDPAPGLHGRAVGRPA